MATGYMLPNGIRSYGRGFDFTSYGTGMKFVGGSHYVTRYAYMGGYGYIRICVTYSNNAPSIDYQLDCRSGRVYTQTSDSSVLVAYAGEITSFTYYSISVKAQTKGSSVAGGTISGDGNYDTGTTYTIKATPNSGFLLTSLTAYSDTLPELNSVELTQTANADQTYVAVFQKYYTLTYNANNGDSTSVPTDVEKHYYLSGTGKDYVTISSKVPTRSGYTFLGWSSSATGNVEYTGGNQYSNLTDGDSVTLYAIWAHYTLSYNTNGGSPMTYPAVSGALGDTIVLPNAIVVTKNGYVLSAWEIDGIEYSPSAKYTLTDQDLTATAIWRRPTIYISNSDTNNGLLKLYRGSFVSSNLIATESDGILSADVTDGTYIVYCEQKDNLYYGKGIGISANSIDYAASIDSDGLCTTRLILANNAIELSFYYTKRATYSIDFAITPTNTGSVILQKQTKGAWPTSPSEASRADEIIEGVNKWLPQLFRFFVTPSEGYNFTSLHVVDEVDGTSSQPSVKNPPISPNYYQCDLVEMDDNSRVDLVFEKKKFSVGVSIDAASELYGAVTVSAGSTKSETGLNNVEYGSSVTFTATLKSGVSASDYKFEGWYINDVRVSTSVSYAYTVTMAVTAVAKFAARTRLGAVFEDNREDKSTAISESATLQVNNVAVANNTYDSFIVLGGRVSFNLTPNAMGAGLGNWSFNAWYDATDTTYKIPYEYNRIDELTISKSISLIARLTALKIECKMIVKVHVNNPATEVMPDLTNPIITSSLTSTIESGGYAFTLDGSGLLSLTASSVLTYNNKSYSFNGWATGTPVSCGYAILSKNITYIRYLTNRLQTIYALYGEPMEMEITASYCNGCDRTMGTLTIGDESNATTGVASISVKAKQGSTLTLSAYAKNGYRFKCWLLNRNQDSEVVSSDAIYSLSVVGAQTFYALFVRDTNAIYEWEGSNTNKMFKWRSKVYVSPKPFNPSALRVDTEGYPVGEVRVGMFSAPDSDETAISVLSNVASQDARRLPKRRPERYIQVTFKNDHEVDSAVISTSMEGLAV